MENNNKNEIYPLFQTNTLWDLTLSIGKDIIEDTLYLII